MPSPDEFIRFNPNGMVEECRLQVVKAVPVSEFMGQMRSRAPEIIKTPPLPRGTIGYVKQPSGRHTIEIITLCYASQVRTISWRHNDEDGDVAAIENYNIAFPHMLVRFYFENQNLHRMNVAVVKNPSPSSHNEQVYNLLCPNVHPDGAVCIALENQPGDLVKSCEHNADLFFHCSPFSNDLRFYPHDVLNMREWEEKTKEGADFILNQEWPRMVTLGEFMSGENRTHEVPERNSDDHEA